MRAALRVVSAGLAAAVWGREVQTAYATATATATATARVCISNTMLKAAKQQSSKAAKQQSSKAAKQQSSKAAKQQSRDVVMQ
ncbi:hypothetical protein J7361_20290 [Xanthomonas phaseoli pv. dieffenbachiae]|uniref:hypothetical protein n=1 Tax=Xanthomonas phaseoli TaxID=1985254 RepID=UPI001ADAE5EC|nr:hypothetical protein [Xanthomonas phaseoli pv. dieffenbachiae]MBO9968964.1 hypothetical protein [Xanthomonas phaseoli pv. dieffenbachiae]MBO9989080.1 hypothetical protein [Xanthomonas phaseoli pv. dieffenbachiae]